MFAHASEPPTPPSERAGKPIDEEFSQLLMRMLAKTPSERLPDAVAFRQALEVIRDRLAPLQREKAAAMAPAVDGELHMTGVGLAELVEVAGPLAPDPGVKAATVSNERLALAMTGTGQNASVAKLRATEAEAAAAPDLRAAEPATEIVDAAPQVRREAVVAPVPTAPESNKAGLWIGIGAAVFVLAGGGWFLSNSKTRKKAAAAAQVEAAQKASPGADVAVAGAKAVAGARAVVASQKAGAAPGAAAVKALAAPAPPVAEPTAKPVAAAARAVDPIQAKARQMVDQALAAKTTAERLSLLRSAVALDPDNSAYKLLLDQAAKAEAAAAKAKRRPARAKKKRPSRNSIKPRVFD
jgi:hypothetical protein